MLEEKSARDKTSYDVVPYSSHPFPQTHPDHLATIANLLGIHPPRIESSRILELGCAGGGNLTPMALGLPDCQFVGIDLSTRQIADGQALIERLQLTNIELKHASIDDVDEDYGQFDFIICHGVYSWVPAEIQNEILRVFSENLVSNGVAYVSYNTYPGWHMRGMIRDMMAYHSAQFNEPGARVRQARNLLDFLAKSVAQDNTPYSALLQAELAVVRQSSDSYLFHEHLEENNDPVYFHEFVERAKSHGLKYLGEADLRVMVPGNFPPEIENVLQMLAADDIHMEQYMDFLRNRTFRQTLLCHDALSPDFNITANRLETLHVASPAKLAESVGELHADEYAVFEGLDGVRISVRQPLAKAALLHLIEVWPRNVPFSELTTTARRRLGLPAADAPTTLAADAQVIAQCLLTAYSSALNGLVQFHVRPPELRA